MISLVSSLKFVLILAAAGAISVSAYFVWQKAKNINSKDKLSTSKSYPQAI